MLFSTSFNPVYIMHRSHAVKIITIIIIAKIMI